MATQNGQDLIKTAGNGEKLNDIADWIRAQMKVPLIQNCFNYVYKADVTTPLTKDDEAAEVPAVENKAEMLAFCSGALLPSMRPRYVFIWVLHARVNLYVNTM